ncbi:TVP38/TMEM64 family protein [Pectinatus haikarae]|uniref:TVP38/TMEM64 family membrane protein n=1 Tax=Pectinatus haikarae TaxID=349096 RepID=A0ABT9Y7V3_9FIRM|nr:TVP38/TMEM64 family protein [Pectinatus haikarae]MDQ0203814.1 putative membrane protein YdjX (TVP38/TMEM64 family) [Pectinatus haikarae]
MNSEKKIKIAGYALIIILVGSIYIISPNFYNDLFRVILSGDMKEIAAYIDSFGNLAIFFGFMLVLLINIVGLPSIFAITANGLLFGPAIGIIISWIAETVGVILGFLLMRTILRPSAEKLIHKSTRLSKIDDLSGKNGFKLMLVLRSLPYFPSGVLTAFGAISKISLKDYSLSSLIGKLPATALEVMIGHDIFTYNQNLNRLAIVIAISVIVYGGLWFFNKKYINGKK